MFHCRRAVAGFGAYGTSFMQDATGADGAPLITFYGDDFTGSTDSLEALALAGVPAKLFLEPPTPADLARHPGLAAIGVAGTSRSRSPQWMDAELPAVFEKLRALGAPLNHYKTCSTFDSAPHVGSIGRAAEIGLRVFGSTVLCMVGVVRHERYVVFSNLFAAASISGGREVFRIDRHPTMSRHPVTPMHDGDLRDHLAKQTAARIAGFDFRAMTAANASEALAELAGRCDIVVLDTFDAATQRIAGRLIAEHGDRAACFVVGSSGVEYGLADHLTTLGRLPLAPVPAPCGAVDRLLALCGSCSPVTAGQIGRAEADGFAVVALDTARLVAIDEDAAVAAVAAELRAAARRSSRVLAHTARGPDDPRLGPTRAALEARGLGELDSSTVLGHILGRGLAAAVAEGGFRRVVLAGGDSSSHAVSALGAETLEVAGPLVPGAPLCRIGSLDRVVDGLEISLKGGQVGAPDFFSRVASGR